MQTIEEIRREWVEVLIAKHGTIAALNQAVGRERTDAVFSQIRNQSPDSKTGRPRTMGSELARDTERALNMEPGTLDHPPPVPPKMVGEPLNDDYRNNIVQMPVEPPLRRELLNLVEKMSERGLVLLIDQAEQIAARHPKAQANPAS